MPDEVANSIRNNFRVDGAMPVTMHDIERIMVCNRERLLDQVRVLTTATNNNQHNMDHDNENTLNNNTGE